jgi:membrane associated rhomboid family serine protease
MSAREIPSGVGYSTPQAESGIVQYSGDFVAPERGDVFFDRSHQADLTSGTLGQSLLQTSVEKPLPKPYFCYSMIFINVMVFVFSLYKADWKFAPQSENPLLGPAGTFLTDMGAKDTPKILQGDWYRLLSAMFLHGGLFHLLFNMVSLYRIGPALEDDFGKLRIALVYFTAGLMGNITSAAFLPLQLTVGASGAIFGLFGATWAEFIQNCQLYKGQRCKVRRGEGGAYWAAGG